MAEVSLRPVEIGDLETFYAQQADPVASEMAAFPSRDHGPFIEHWTERVLPGPTNYSRTIVVDGEIAGNVVSWIDPENGHRLFGYWLGREFWGRGIATDAVRLAVEEIPERPIYADVAAHNIGSRRVLEKNGFVAGGSEPRIEEDGIELIVFVLN